MDFLTNVANRVPFNLPKLNEQSPGLMATLTGQVKSALPSLPQLSSLTSGLFEPRQNRRQNLGAENAANRTTLGIRG